MKKIKWILTAITISIVIYSNNLISANVQNQSNNNDSFVNTLNNLKVIKDIKNKELCDKKPINLIFKYSNGISNKVKNNFKIGNTHGDSGKKFSYWFDTEKIYDKHNFNDYLEISIQKVNEPENITSMRFEYLNSYKYYYTRKQKLNNLYKDSVYNIKFYCNENEINYSIGNKIYGPKQNNFKYKQIIVGSPKDVSLINSQKKRCHNHIRPNSTALYIKYSNYAIFSFKDKNVLNSSSKSKSIQSTINNSIITFNKNSTKTSKYKFIEINFITNAGSFKNYTGEITLNGLSNKIIHLKQVASKLKNHYFGLLKREDLLKIPDAIYPIVIKCKNGEIISQNKFIFHIKE